ncbi:MAG: hypothetical protein GXO94_08485, partial [Nitrospirae bacterium]|nr:hypothetical protein [Nitrospirota bacterium]
DIGILLSDDIVAVEQASIDLILKERHLPSSMADGTGEAEDIFRGLHNKPYELQVSEAERLGLGSRRYELVTIGADVHEKGDRRCS